MIICNGDFHVVHVIVSAAIALRTEPIHEDVSRKIGI